MRFFNFDNFFFFLPKEKSEISAGQLWLTHLENHKVTNPDFSVDSTSPLGTLPKNTSNLSDQTGYPGLAVIKRRDFPKMSIFDFFALIMQKVKFSQVFSIKND